MSAGMGHRDILAKLEQERHNRRMADLSRQYDALRTHLDAISQETKEHYERQMAIVTSGPIAISIPASKSKPMVVKPAPRIQKSRKKARGRR